MPLLREEYRFYPFWYRFSSFCVCKVYALLCNSGTQGIASLLGSVLSNGQVIIRFQRCFRVHVRRPFAFCKVEELVDEAQTMSYRSTCQWV